MRRVPLLIVLGGFVALVGLVLATGSRIDEVSVAPGVTEECAPFQATTVPGQTTLTSLSICEDTSMPDDKQDDAGIPVGTAPPLPPPELPTTEGPDESEDRHDQCLLVEDMGDGVTHTVQVADCVATTNPPSVPNCDVPRTTLQGDTDLPCTTSGVTEPVNSLGMEPEALARYCNAISRTMFAEAGEQYIEEVNNLADLAPSEHREVWTQMGELAAEFSYPVFNSAADQLDKIGDELDQVCPNPPFVVDDEGLLRYRG